MKSRTFSELQSLLTGGFTEDIMFNGTFSAFSNNTMDSLFYTYGGDMTVTPFPIIRNNNRVKVYFPKSDNYFHFEQRDTMTFDEGRLGIYIPISLTPTSSISITNIRDIKY